MGRTSKNIVLLFIITTAAVFLFGSNQALSISDEQRRIFNYNIEYFNECSTSSSGGSISDAVANANDNADAVFKALTSYNFKSNNNKPLNVVQAAAVLGNLQSESGFDPTLTGSYNGIAQWGGGRWDAVKEPKTDLTNQIEHLIDEMDNGYSDALSELWSASTVDDLAKATFAFARNYEVAITAHRTDTRWVSHSEASAGIQGWDENSSTGYANPRWPNAQAWYNFYKDTDIASTSSANTRDGRIIWVGDSRTEGMSTAITSGNNEWVYKSSVGYDWFVSDAISSVNNKLQEDDTIVFNFGVNDLGNVDKYINKLNELASGDWKNAEIIVMSVNPVIDGKNGASNAGIEEFNSKMKSGLDSTITFIDTYSELKDSLTSADYDSAGLHYTSEVYQKLYDIIRNGTSDGKSITGECLESSSLGATKYANDGSAIYYQCDEQWANASFGSSTVCPSGCGPSAMAMIITAITGESVTPDMTARDGASAYVPGAGSSHSLPEILSSYYDIRVEKIGASVDNFNEVLDNGGMVWMCGSGAEPFTDGGHCVALRARTSSGKWLMFDSAGRDPNAEYDPQFIASHAGGATAVYKK